MKHDLAQRKAAVGKAICFLRLCSGIVTVREADRIYGDRVRPGAYPMQFGSKLSKWERGHSQPSCDALFDLLALFDCGFQDFEIAVEVMALVEAKGVASLRRAYDQEAGLKDRFESLVGEGDNSRFVVFSAAEEAAARA